jgi:protein TonB
MKLYAVLFLLVLGNTLYATPIVYSPNPDEVLVNVGDTSKKKNAVKKPVKEEELVTIEGANEILVEGNFSDDSSEILLECEVAPGFLGGFDSLAVFLSKNLKYPTLAKENGIEGRVVVRFVVEKDGTLTNITLLRKVGWGCDDEATRLIKQMPNWTPGKMNGKPVRTYYTLPIVFSLK